MNTILPYLLGYLALVFGVAWYFSRKESLGAYFINSKKTGLWLMTFSTAATVVGAGSSVAIVSEVYNSGISYGLALPISLVFGMLILGMMAKRIKTIGDKYDAYTVVDFFASRFDVRNKILTGILQVLLLIIWIGVQAIAISSLTSVLVGLEYEVALVLTALVVILYTTIGGLKIDIITDFIQFWIILAVFLVLAVMGYGEVGSISSLLASLPEGHLDPFAFGGVSWMVGAIALSGFIYLGNTTHWQRIFAAKNQRVARNSFWLSIPFVIIFGIIILFLGLVAAVLLGEVKQETAIFLLMNEILPPSLVGLGFAAILAVVMSSIDSLLVGGSTIIYRAMFRKNQFDSKKELFYARLITALFGMGGFLLAFAVPNIVTLSLVVSYLALIFVPPIIAGVYSDKFSANASFWAILIPTALLFILYPFLQENTFVITSPLGILMVIFYDKIFRKRLPDLI